MGSPVGADSKQSEKEYLRRTAGGAWERLKPFSPPGTSTLGDSAALIQDFAAALQKSGDVPKSPLFINRQRQCHRQAPLNNQILMSARLLACGRGFARRQIVDAANSFTQLVRSTHDCV